MGAEQGESAFYKKHIKTLDGQAITLNTQYPVIVRHAVDHMSMQSLLAYAQSHEQLEIKEFTTDMQQHNDDKKVEKVISEKNFADIIHLGVIIFGEKTLLAEIEAKYNLQK